MVNKRILNKIDELKKELDRLRPLKQSMVELLRENLLIEWVYNSNAIEGNSLSLGETAFFLKEGLTTEGKPLKDFLEAQNHKEAILAMEDMLRQRRPLSQSFIKQLQAVLLKGVEFIWVKGSSGKMVKKRVEVGKYKTQPNHVLTLSGKLHCYTEPIKVQSEMDRLMVWYEKRGSKISVVERAAIFHYKFVKIHPFDDGNGRLARILMNLILMKDGFLPAVIKNDKRREYLRSLELADKGKLDIFVDFVGGAVMETMERSLMVLKGKKLTEDLWQTTPTADQRQKKILEVLSLGEKYSIGDVLTIISIKRPTLKKDLSKLVKDKKLKKTGQGKGTRYIKR